MIADEWTDESGTVHIRAHGTDEALCGASICRTSTTRPRVGCDACVAESIADYARTHDCRKDCMATELLRRKPQASTAAQLDRRLSWSGRITPPATGCSDLDLMQRVCTALIAQLADPDAAESGDHPTDPTQE